MPAMSAKKVSKSELLESIFDRLCKLHSNFSPPLEIYSRHIKNKRDFNLRIPKAVSIPPAYGGKPVQLDLAGLILQKGYVGFYFTPIYLNPALKSKLSPSLLKNLKGKTCFYIRKLDEDQIKNIEFALGEGVKLYKQKGWL